MFSSNFSTKRAVFNAVTMKIVSATSIGILILFEVTILISSTPLSEFKNNARQSSKKSLDIGISEKSSAMSENLDDSRDASGGRQKRFMATAVHEGIRSVLYYLYENKLKKWPKKFICLFTNCSPTPPPLPPSMHISGSSSNAMPPLPVQSDVIVENSPHQNVESNFELKETVPASEPIQVVEYDQSSSDNSTDWSPNTNDNENNRKRKKRCIVCALVSDASRLMLKVANIPAQILHFPQRMLRYQDNLESVKHVYPQAYNPYRTYSNYK
ncbi:hypothetical protein WA026_001981 [Henosepilachna vigintioctopunctata]|uniref:Uncharacterized protein n=1 Tax=Henosepilachna vigintioctopunctata TaxID=420089 RepID=A0AAW1UVC0_9CUCU